MYAFKIVKGQYDVMGLIFCASQRYHWNLSTNPTSHDYKLQRILPGSHLGGAEEERKQRVNKKESKDYTHFHIENYCSWRRIGRRFAIGKSRCSAKWVAKGNWRKWCWERSEDSIRRRRRVTAIWLESLMEGSDFGGMRRERRVGNGIWGFNVEI